MRWVRDTAHKASQHCAEAVYQTGGYIANIKLGQPGLRIHQLSSGVMLITARGTHTPALACLMPAPPLSGGDDFIMEVSQMSQFFFY